MRNVCFLLLATLFVFSGASPLAAQNTKPLQICLSPAGALAAKAKCSRKEERLTSTTLLQKLTGAPGPQGPAGVVDPTRCTTRSQTFSGFDYLYGEAHCASGEFLLTHGVDTSTVNSDVISISLLYLPNESFPRGVGYETGANTTGAPLAYAMTVRAVCCTQ